jgi:hypothetical protein
LCWTTKEINTGVFTSFGLFFGQFLAAMRWGKSVIPVYPFTSGPKSPDNELRALVNLNPIVFLPHAMPRDAAIFPEIMYMVHVDEQSQCHHVLHLPHQFERRCFVGGAGYKLIGKPDQIGVNLRRRSNRKVSVFTLNKPALLCCALCNPSIVFGDLLPFLDTLE